MSILFFTIIKVKRIIVIIIIIHSGGTHFVVVHVSVVVRVVVLGFRIRVVKIAARLPPHHLYLSLETFASMTKLSFPLKKSPK
jgi:dihydroorotase-like cyclic amidohydrolase